MAKIFIVIPYFGRFPEMAQLFFYTAGYNRQVEFLLFTDNKKPDNLPGNVKYYHFSLKDFNILASEKLGINIKVVYPYKLCDFKPMYGLIFEDFLTESSFWGYCDLDMVFGNITGFLHDGIFENFDVITSRKDALAGNFTLFRNIAGFRNLFKKSDCWQQILKNNLWVFSFPEKFNRKGRPVSGNLFLRIKYRLCPPKFNSTALPDMNRVLAENKTIRVYYGNFIQSDMILQNSKIKNWSFKWQKGELTDSKAKTPFMYFHFYFLKKKKNFVQNNINLNNIRFFTISNNGLTIN